MTLRYADRVLEQVAAPAAPATGPFAISATAQWQTTPAAVSSFQTFANIPHLRALDTVCYVATDGTNTEVGVGTWTSGSLARTTILTSSNGGAACSFTSTVTVSCTAPAEMLAPALGLSPAVYNVLQYGLANDAIQIGNGGISITSGTAALAVAGASFVATDVGKAISVPGAGASGLPLNTTISAFTSATQVTLAANASTTLSGVTTALVTYGTDNTTALQALVTLVAGTDQISATIFFPAGIYLLNGPLQASPGGKDNAVILFPDRNVSTGPLTITIEGQAPTAGGYSIIGAQAVPLTGSILVTGQGGTTGVPALFGGDSAASFGNFTQVTAAFRNIALRTYNNPQIIPIDARYLMALTTDGVQVDVGVAPQSIATQTNNNAIGIATPLNNNGAWTRVVNTQVYGYYIGAQVNEHSVLNNVDVWLCQVGFFVNTSYHSMFAGRLLVTHCVTPIEFANGGSTGVATIEIEELDIEYLTSGAFTTTTFLSDPSNYGHGSISWHTVNGTAGSLSNTFTVSGGTGLRLKQIMAPTAVAAVTVGASPFAYTAAQAGTVAVSGGTVSAISATHVGTNVPTGLTAGMIPVSSGDTVTITYTAAPTVNFIPS